MTDERSDIIRKILAPYRSAAPSLAPEVRMRVKPKLSVDFGKATAAEIAERDRYYMSAALQLAYAAAERGEAPVGALIVMGEKIIAADFNGREEHKNALYHAEVSVISEACEALGGWRLPGCELYVTLEPCSMCAGAIVSARLPRVVYGASDEKAGAYGGLYDMRSAGLNHTPEVIPGVMGEECTRLMRDFFSSKRRPAPPSR